MDGSGVLALDPSRQNRDLRGRIGCQLQEAALPAHLKVWEALDLFASGTAAARLAGGPRAMGAEGEAARRLLPPLWRAAAAPFIALALVTEPEAVFLDELTQGSNRPPAGSPGIWSGRSVTGELPWSWVTHFMDEASNSANG
jgi:ABC-2 type transport system ATP-binding protein